MAYQHKVMELHRGGNTPVKLCVRRLRRRFLGVEDRRFLFISCFAKSGSTYLMTLLATLTGFPRVMPVQFRGSNEQDFDARKLERIRDWDAVCHQHLKGTENNVKLLLAHRIKVVVLLRNIFDVVMSLDDHLQSEGLRVPTGYVPRHYTQMSPEERWMFIIRLHVPWYFNYVMSWSEAQEQVPTHWLTYEELFADVFGTVRRLLTFWDVPATDEQIRAAIEQTRNKNTRLNKGVSGRGRGLPQAHRDVIMDIAQVCRLNPACARMIGVS